MRLDLILAAFFAFGLTAQQAQACSATAACDVAGGNYRIAMPEGSGSKGVLLFFHGYKSSAELQMGHAALVDVAHRHGMAFAAVDGEDGTWSHDNAPAKGRDEIAFIGAVLDDLNARFGFDADRVVIGGFSQGASMAWYSACRLGNRVAGAVTLSGVFWNPLPVAADCVSAIPPLVHVHGRADRTFPLSGRAIGAQFHQGDTFKSVDILREAAQCGPARVTRTVGTIACDVSPGCQRGEIALCLHDGGHQVRPEHVDAALSALGF